MKIAPLLHGAPLMYFLFLSCRKRVKRAPPPPPLFSTTTTIGMLALYNLLPKRIVEYPALGAQLASAVVVLCIGRR